MALTGQKYGVFESKVWHFWVVTHGVLAEPDNGLWLRRTTRQLVNETTRLWLRKTTRQRVNETTSGAAAGITESRNYGITEASPRLRDLGYARQQDN